MTLSTENLWTLLRDDLRRFFRSRVQDEHRAEDLVQETFVRVHDHLGEVVDADRLTGWIFRIAKNVWIDQLRRTSPQPESDVVSETASETPDSEENFNTDVSGWARSMIELLPADDRRALELSELEGLRQTDVAERLGLSISGAKSRIQRGRAKLRAMLLACCHLEFDGHGNVVDYHARERCEGCGPECNSP